jgi:hypothetical protein
VVRDDRLRGSRRPAVKHTRRVRNGGRRGGSRSDDIDALTDVFKEVRYGGASATPAREREAIKALRRIERRYGGER